MLRLGGGGSKRSAFGQFSWLLRRSSLAWRETLLELVYKEDFRLISGQSQDYDVAFELDTSVGSYLYRYPAS
jgi:hypothetical protein